MSRKKGAMQIHPEQCWTIVELSSSGMKQENIALHLKLHRAAVSAILKRYKGNKTFIPVKTRHGKYGLNERSYFCRNLIFCKSCFQSLHVITAKFVEDTGITVPVSIVWRCLRRSNSNGYVAVLKSFLKTRHTKNPLEWTERYSKWDHSKWY